MLRRASRLPAPVGGTFARRVSVVSHRPHSSCPPAIPSLFAHAARWLNQRAPSPRGGPRAPWRRPLWTPSERSLLKLATMLSWVLLAGSIGTARSVVWTFPTVQGFGRGIGCRGVGFTSRPPQGWSQARLPSGSGGCRAGLSFRCHIYVHTTAGGTRQQPAARGEAVPSAGLSQSGMAPSWGPRWSTRSRSRCSGGTTAALCGATLGNKYGNNNDNNNHNNKPPRDVRGRMCVHGRAI